MVTRILTALALALFANASVFSAGNEATQDTVVVNAETEAAINGALKYLAASQDSSGGWPSNPGTGSQQHGVAMTGYVLMALLAAGNLPEEGEYSKNVTLGMQFLLDQLQPDGTYRDPKGHDYMYSHGIATIALAELYGQTRSPQIRPKLERAIKLIIGAQNKEGGWRYEPHPRDADISVSVLQVVALRAAKNAGLDVPQTTIDEAIKYVRSCWDEKKGAFAYRPHENPGFSRTAAAIYSLQVCGQYDDPLVLKGSEFLFKNRNDHQFYSYGHYYAAPAHYMIGGETWRNWYEGERAQILKEALRKGDQIHWDAARDGGPGSIFSTAVNVVILAMPYHYVPLYQR